MKKITQSIIACLVILYPASSSAQNYIDVFKLGASQHDEAQGIFQDSQGNIYLGGNFEGTVDFDPGSGEALITAENKYDAYLAKYDENRNYIWAISISGQEWIYGRQLVVDNEGNIYFAGYFKGEADFDPGAGEFLLTGEDVDGFVAKYDQNGNFIWAFDIGNENNCTANDLTLDHEGNLWVSGIIQGEVDFDPSSSVHNLTGHGFQDAFMAKYTPDGEYIWVGGIGGEQSTFSMPSIICDESGNLYYAGHFNNNCDLDPGTGTMDVVSEGSSDMYVVKLSSSGDFQWGFSMGGEMQDQIKDICYHNGKIFVTGMFEADIDFDPSSGSANFSSTDDYDAFIATYTPAGEYGMALAIAGLTENCPAEGSSIEVDDDGNMFITGAFYGTVDFNPSSASNELISLGDWDIFTAKYDKNGNYLWAIQAGSNDSDYGYNSFLSNDQETIMLCGKFKGYCIFDNAGTGYAVSSSGGFDAFLAVYGTYDGAGIGEGSNNETTILVYPNPVSDQLNIELDKGTGSCRYMISTSTGTPVSSGILYEGNNALDVTGLSHGIYFVSIRSKGQEVVRKIVIE